MAGLQLGFRLDPAIGKAGSDRLTVESGDLTTHAAIVDMTGSGKTGLAIVMLEEALLGGIPGSHGARDEAQRARGVPVLRGLG